MVCFKIVFFRNACLFPIFPCVCIGSHFHHGGLVDCLSLCSSQCFLFVVFVTCYELCCLCSQIFCLDVWYAIHTFFVLQHASSSFVFATSHLLCLLCVYEFHAAYLYDAYNRTLWFVSKLSFLAMPVCFQSFLAYALEVISIMVVWLIVNPCVLLNVSFLLFLSHVMNCVSFVLKSFVWMFPFVVFVVRLSIRRIINQQSN